MSYKKRKSIKVKNIKIISIKKIKNKLFNWKGNLKENIEKLSFLFLLFAFIDIIKQ